MQNKNKKSDLKKLAEKARDDLLSELVNLPKASGAELLLRKRQSGARWEKAPLEKDFSLKYRKQIQENIEIAFESDIALLEYDAVIDGEFIGVAYRKEIESFLKEIPSRGGTKDFNGTVDDFSNFDQRAVRIQIPGKRPLLAFGAASTKPIAQFGSGRMFAMFDSKKIVAPPKSGFLNVGHKVTFFVYEDYVFVIENSNFASMTNFRKVVLKRAKVAIRQLKKLPFLDIENFDELEKLCETSPNFARRISASDARGYFKGLSRDGFLDCMDQFNITFDWDDDGTTISLRPDFDDVEQKQQFQKLMTQVFVTCAMTGQRLEALKAVKHG
ncbi:MAG: hypothetical protein CME85_00935 [Henriciella sp.]|nr:hypothetical protein [Henriciella sp.]